MTEEEMQKKLQDTEKQITELNSQIASLNVALDTSRKETEELRTKIKNIDDNKNYDRDLDVIANEIIGEYK